MKKWVQNYILFVLMFLLGLFQAVNGFLLWLVIPGGGYRGGRGLTGDESIFIWNRQTWVDIHHWTAVALIVLVAVHLILHWKWILFTTRKALGIESKAEEL